MVGASKILTVSYGTFSCTLEGFDEPFSTMKAIAEYFRDLAADDRYFGAEPPTPDAEMLHRIAEKEIARRVESKISQNGVILRQSDEPAAPVVMPAPVTEPEVAPLAAAPAPVVAEVMAEEPPVDAMDAPPAAAPDTSPTQMPDSAAGQMIVAADLEAPVMPMAEPAVPDAEAGDDSIAAKLMRIRAVVEGVRAAPRATDDMDYDEDEVAPAATAAADQPGDFGFDVDLSNNMPELEAAEIARAEARALSDEADEAPMADEPATDPATSDEDSDLLARLSQLGAETRIDPAPEAVPAPVATKPAKTKSLAPWYVADEDDGDEDMATAAPAVQPEEPAAQPSFYQRARARMLRLGHAVTHSSDDMAADDAPPAPAAAIENGQSSDEEWAYDDEPGAYEDEADRHEDPDISRLMAEAKTKIEGPENRRRFSAISHLKAAVAATLADRQLRPETQVADAADERTEINLYREDLSKVVRPQTQSEVDSLLTPEPAPEPAAEPARAAPAPLILVSEQRVDAPAATSSDAIRPRRVTVASISYADEDDEDLDEPSDPSPEDVSSFAEFADKLGAHSLTELLEAAAAYTASVEGRTSFSRPHLLRKVEFVSTRGAFNREDGMRSFGMLLREGKIQKVSHGQFAITGSSKFLNDARKAI